MQRMKPKSKKNKHNCNQVFYWMISLGIEKYTIFAIWRQKLLVTEMFCCEYKSAAVIVVFQKIFATLILYRYWARANSANPWNSLSLSHSVIFVNAEVPGKPIEKKSEIPVVRRTVKYVTKLYFTFNQKYWDLAFSPWYRLIQFSKIYEKYTISMDIYSFVTYYVKTCVRIIGIKLKRERFFLTPN